MRPGLSISLKLAMRLTVEAGGHGEAALSALTRQGLAAQERFLRVRQNFIGLHDDAGYERF